MDSSTHVDAIRKPFAAHLQELQKRLIWVSLSIAALGFGAYFIHEQLVNLLRQPLGQTLYYTSPMGGFTFLFKLCMVAGLIASLPVVLYHIFEFLGPMLKKRHRLVIITYTFWSFILACAGVLFAYFISLPSALHFLTQFGDKGIESLIGANEYFNFALAYVGGLALLFQIPLLLLFINRITPLSPKKLLKAQRFVIAGSFIVAAMLTPTPDPFNQALMALPMIVLYQLSILLIWRVNKRRKPVERYDADILVTDEIFRAIMVDQPSQRTATAPSKSIAPRRIPVRNMAIDIQPRRRTHPLPAQQRTVAVPAPVARQQRYFEDIRLVTPTQ